MAETQALPAPPRTDLPPADPATSAPMASPQTQGRVIGPAEALTVPDRGQYVDVRMLVQTMVRQVRESERCIEEARQAYRRVARFNPELPGELGGHEMGERLARLQSLNMWIGMRLGGTPGQPLDFGQSGRLLQESATLERWLKYLEAFPKILQESESGNAGLDPQLALANAARTQGNLTSMGTLVDSYADRRLTAASEELARNGNHYIPHCGTAAALLRESLQVLEGRL